jgi:hypothetical protein
MEDRGYTTFLVLISELKTLETYSNSFERSHPRISFLPKELMIYSILQWLSQPSNGIVDHILE